MTDLELAEHKLALTRALIREYPVAVPTALLAMVNVSNGTMTIATLKSHHEAWVKSGGGQ